MDDEWYQYTGSERNVAIVHSVAGILSALSSSTLVVHLLVMTVRPMIQRRREGTAAAREPESNQLKRQVSLFLLALFSSDLFQSLTGLMQIRWASKGGIELKSAACRTQGIALMAGDLGVSYFNVVMAVHTFLTVVALRTISFLTTGLIIFGGIVFIVVFSVVGPVAIADKRGQYYGIAGLWCFIRDPYVEPRFWLHYFIMYCSIFMICVIYVIVFWKLRQRQPSRLESTQVMSNPLGDQTQERRSHYNAISYKMLTYPASYAIMVLPISIGRLIQVTGANPPQSFLNFGICVLMLSGFVNGIQYVLTRKALSPFQYFSAPRPRLPFMRKERAGAPVIWVQTERQRHEGADSKYSVELGDSSGRVEESQESTVKISSSSHM